MRRQPTRRQFLRSLSRWGAAAAAGGAVLGASGCGEAIEPRDAVAARVEALHRRLGGLPESPVAVARAGRKLLYPYVGDPADYDRERNPCYPVVEEALMLLNPDNPANPLSGTVRPGDTVAIKPNWCTQYIFPMPITHPSIIHAVAELAAEAGAARVRIVEGPMTLTHRATWFYGASFLHVQPWLEHLRRKHPQTAFEHRDANADEFTWVALGDRSVLRELPLDALCHDAGPVRDDMFYDVPDSRGVDPRRYEHGLYAIANSYFDCDLFINLPKMKTHTWTAVTLALKNVMGLSLISTVYRMPPERLAAYEAREDLQGVREAGMRDVPHFDGRRFSIDDRYRGASTNDVLWRSLADLNRILLYCDRAGRLQPTRQRRVLHVVDGIIGTEGNGPITPSPVRSRTIVAGEDPVRVDAVCARLMGYEPKEIILIRNTGELGAERPVGRLAGYEQSVVSAEAAGTVPRGKHFQPPDAWLLDGGCRIWHEEG